MRKLLPTISIAILLTIIAACSSECLENKNALPLALFVVANDSNSTVQQVSVDSIRVTGIGAPGDSVLWDGGSMQTLYIPFRTDSDTTQYRFTEMRSGVSDIVTFIYTRSPRFVSNECGVSFVYDIRSITSQGVLIDSVTCELGEITNKNIENLKIYLRHE